MASAALFTDLIWDTTATSGTGTLTLAGPKSGYQGASALGNGNSGIYHISDTANNAYEVGIGTWSSGGTYGTLSRDLVIVSSNGGSKVSLAGATVDVTITVSGHVIPQTIAQGNVLLNGGHDFAQRQTPGTLTTIATDKYGPDRSRASSQSASLQHQRIDTNGALETGITARYYSTWKQITNAGKFLLCQPIESFQTFPLASRNLLYQLKLKASSAKTIRIAVLQLNSSGTVDAIPATLVTTWGANGADPTPATNVAVVGAAVSCSVTTAWQLFYVACAAPSNAKNLIVALWTDGQFAANDTLSVTEEGLYDGWVPRQWLPRPYAQELELLKRYFEKTVDPDTVAADGAVAGFSSLGVAIANNSVFLSWPFTVTKRVAPTMAYFEPSVGGTAGKWSYFNGGWAAFDGGGTNSVVTGAITMNWTKSTNPFTANSTYLMGGNYTADAEM